MKKVTTVAQQNRKVLIVAAVAMLVVMAATNAFALTFDLTAFGSDFHDIAVNQFLKGPLGYLTGLGSVIWGCSKLFLGAYGQAVTTILAGFGLMKADDLVSSFGMII